MKQLKDIGIYTLLLLWGVCLCLSVSYVAEKVQDPFSQKLQKSLKEQVNQEEQNSPTAWSEQTAPLSSAANPAEQLTAILLAASYFLFLYQWRYPSQKAFKAPLSFSSLTEQFRILPNAP